MASMNRTIEKDLGPASGLHAVRPTVADLQRARAWALESGEVRRAAAYGAVIAHRLHEAQRAAAREGSAAA
jgi:hypothetical protein